MEVERPFAGRDSDAENVDWVRRPGGGYQARHFAHGYSAYMAVFWTNAKKRHAACEIKVYADESALGLGWGEPTGEPVWSKRLLCVGSLRTFQPMTAKWMQEFVPARAGV